MKDGLNLGNSIFKGFNDNHGIMICGYEWGFSKSDERDLNESGKNEFDINEDAITTFSNKVPRFGDRALKWRYDNRIKKWFSMWGHPLDIDGVDDDFSKTIVQTNWSDTCNNNIPNISERCLSTEAINNFIHHVDLLRPKVILFMGSKLGDFIRDHDVIDRFTAIVGKEIEEKEVKKKKSDGVQFKVSFDFFENCTVVCFPHPSSSVGLSDEYIKEFYPEMNKLLSDFKNERNIK